MIMTIAFRWAWVAIVFISCQTTLAITLNDTGKISKTDVTAVVQVKSTTDIRQAILKAKQQQLPITMMGMRHSQGGQSLAKDAIVLNMRAFNKVLHLDRNKKQVTVQSGITWGDLQKIINPYQLAITAMQSPNIFTVGGSISANAHGDDFRIGPVGKSIVAFNLMLANGKEVHVTQREEPALWSAVIGGYGLLGVITEVTLQLTDNHWMISHYKNLHLQQFLPYFQQNILNKKEVTMFYAHLNVVPGENFLREMYIITYDDTGKLPERIVSLVNPDQWNVLLTPTFNFSRHGTIGKQWRWRMEQKVFSKFYLGKKLTRNNAMEKPVTFASNYSARSNADWLQEYFIPIEKLLPFLNKLRVVILKNNINLLNVTLRYVPAETNLLLAYAKDNAFAVVLYFNQDLSSGSLQEAKVWTRQLVETALSLGGKYYLTYQNYATPDQFRRAYPNYKNMIDLKKTYDPDNTFINHFYTRYFTL